MVLERIKRIVARVEIGSRPNGTAFLIGRDHVATALHVLEGHDMASLSFVNWDSADRVRRAKRVWRGYDLAILELDRPCPVEIDLLPCVDLVPSLGASWMSFGFPREVLDGHALPGLYERVSDPQRRVADWGLTIFQLDTKAAREDLSGFSGSPCVLGGEIIGVITHQLKRSIEELAPGSPPTASLDTLFALPITLLTESQAVSLAASRQPARDAAERGARARARVRPPARYVARTGLYEQIRAGIGEQVAAKGACRVALVGMGGSGKSTLARALASDPQCCEQFDSCLWVSIGHATDPHTCQARLFAELDARAPAGDLDTGLKSLRALLGERRHLIVLDDVWHPEQLRALDLASSSVGLLVTTRDRELLGRDFAAYGVDLLDDSLARHMLAVWSEHELDDLPAQADEVIRACGGLPLALAAAGATVSQTSWEIVVHRLRSVDLARLRTDFLDYPEPNLLAALEVGVGALEDTLRARYLQLAVFEGRGVLPLGVLEVVWNDLAEAAVVAFERRSLLQFDRKRQQVVLHDLQFRYTAQALGAARVSELHARLSRAFIERWGGLALGLPDLVARELDAADRYALEHLIDHLVLGDEAQTVHDVLRLDTRTGGASETNLWQVLQDRAGRTASFLRDVCVGWQLAERTTDREEGDARVMSMALEVRYALMHASMASIAQSLPAELLPQLVERGVWSTDQALAYARSILKDSRRAGALLALLRVLSQSEALAVRREAASSAWREENYFVLREVWSDLSAEERSGLMVKALKAATAASELCKPSSMRFLAKLAPAEQRLEILSDALLIASRPDFTGRPNLYEQASTLIALAAQQDGAERQGTLASALDSAEQYSDGGLRCRLLVGIGALMPQGRERERVLKRALRSARKESSERFRAERLLEVAAELPVARRSPILKQALVEAAAQDGQGLAHLADKLPHGLLADALRAARALSDPWNKSRALVGLCPRLPASERPRVADEALAAARQVRASSAVGSPGTELEFAL